MNSLNPLNTQPAGNAEDVLEDSSLSLRIPDKGF